MTKLKYDRKYRHLGSGNWVLKFELQSAIYVANRTFLVAIVLHVHCTVMYYHTCMACTLAFDLTGYFHDVCAVILSFCFLRQCYLYIYVQHL